MTTHAALQASLGNSSCPPNLGGEKNKRFFNTTVEDIASDEIIIKTKALTLADANLIFKGAATSAGLRIGLLDRSGGFVHGFWMHMGTVRSGQSVPSQTRTFHSLQPNEIYLARIFMDKVKGSVDSFPSPDGIPGRKHYTLAQICFLTGPPEAS